MEVRVLWEGMQLWAVGRKLEKVLLPRICIILDCKFVALTLLNTLSKNKIFLVRSKKSAFYLLYRLRMSRESSLGQQRIRHSRVRAPLSIATLAWIVHRSSKCL